MLRANEICTRTHIYGASYVTANKIPAGPRYPLVGPVEW